MNGDRDARPDEVESLGRAERVEMPLRDARAPTRDRQKRDVDRSEVAHALEDVRVPCEVHGAAAGDHEADGLRSPGAGTVRQAVVGVDRPNPQRAEVDLVARRRPR